MSEIKNKSAGSLQKGNYVVMDGVASIVSEVNISRPGKHGHAKVRIKAQDIITGSTKEVVKPGHDNVEVPIILKKRGQILSIDGDTIELMDMETFEQISADLKVADEEVRGSLEAGQTVMFWHVMGKVIIKQVTQEA